MATLRAGLSRVASWPPVRSVVNYLKNLANDYKSVALDTVQDCKDRPVKATLYGGLLSFLFAAYKTNPDEASFREQLIDAYVDMGLVNPVVRNPAAYEHVDHLNQLDSARVLKSINFAFFTLIVRLDYDPKCGVYVSQCDYLKPSYFSYLTERVVDVGVLGSWRVLNHKLRDYDVNPAEWNDVNQDSGTTAA